MSRASELRQILEHHAYLYYVLDKPEVSDSEYDKWFREQVEIGWQEAEDPSTSWVPHEVVKQDIARQRAQLMTRIRDTE